MGELSISKYSNVARRNPANIEGVRGTGQSSIHSVFSIAIFDYWKVYSEVSVYNWHNHVN